MKITEKEVVTTITENKYTNRKDYTVTSQLENHTFVNHAETEDEAAKIAESQKAQLEQLYSTVDASVED